MTLRIFGIITILFWLTNLFLLPPLKNINAQTKRTITEAREMGKMVPELGKSEAVLKAEYARAVQSLAVTFLVIAAGVVSGALLFVRRFSGWIMAIVLCSGLLLLRVAGLVRYYPDVWGRLTVIFTLLLPQHLVAVIYSEIITPLFLIGTAVFLTRKSVSRQIVAEKK